MRTLVAVLCGVPLLAQATLTVNNGGGAMFTDVQPAILAAMPGDRIVVAGVGPYGAFTVNRGVDVEALHGAIVPSFSVVNVPSAQRARVAGFAVTQNNNGWVSVSGCAGRVLLSDLRLAGLSYMVTSGAANPGLSIVNAGNVLVDRGSFKGHASYIGSPGVLVMNANVTMIGTVVTGGVTVSSSPNGGNDGVAGIHVTSGHLVMHNVNSRGGNSASGNVAGGDGGDGIAVAGGLALALGTCTFTGTPASNGFGTPTPGEPVRGNVRYTADTMLVGAASSGTMIPNRPRLSTQPTTALGSNYTLSIAGEPGQWVALALDLASAHTPMPALDGALHLTSTAIVFGFVWLDAQGAGALTLALPNFSAAQHLLIVAQGAADVGGAPVLTAPALTYTY